MEAFVALIVSLITMLVTGDFPGSSHFMGLLQEDSPLTIFVLNLHSILF